MNNSQKELEMIKKAKKIIIFAIVIILAIIEIVLMVFNKDLSLLMSVSMLIISIPDTIIAFVKHDEFRWGDFSVVILYLLLTIVNFLIK